jgi:hypothetical protein
VHFPDVRIEYEEADGRWDHDDINVVTEHYRGAHAASVSKSGFISFSRTRLLCFEVVEWKGNLRGGTQPFLLVRLIFPDQHD